jgi:deazaflavin-dependent oxidoreductase (nitroreductase family)
MPSVGALKAMNTVHRTVLKLSGGRVGWKALRMPVLELTTVGRKSGKPHTVLLTSPVREDETLVVVASRGGDDHHPDWFLNLRDHADVDVRLEGGPKQIMRAKVADADQRARLWPQVTDRYKNYAGYQKKTEREIPLVLLEPADSPAPR